MDEEGLPQSIAMEAEEAGKRTYALYDRFHGKGNLKVYYSLRALNSCSGRLVELEAERARERGTMLQAHMNEYMGEIIDDMNRRRGRIIGMEPGNDQQQVVAEVPQAEMFKYATDLRSMTQARGSFTMRFERRCV